MDEKDIYGWKPNSKIRKDFQTTCHKGGFRGKSDRKGEVRVRQLSLNWKESSCKMRQEGKTTTRMQVVLHYCMQLMMGFPILALQLHL